MAKDTIGPTPFGLITFDCDNLFSEQNLTSLFIDKNEVSVCCRTETGPENRGGYFFHIKKYNDNSFGFFDFKNNEIDILDKTTMISFINHVSGRSFDNNILEYCQSFVNFRRD